jgi:lysozyme family protein
VRTPKSYDAPSGLDVVLLHAAVMRGVRGATRIFQASIGGVPIDGVETVTIFDAVLNPMETAGEMVVRLMHRKLHSKAVGKYGRGWADRLLAVYEIAKSLDRS